MRSLSCLLVLVALPLAAAEDLRPSTPPILQAVETVFDDDAHGWASSDGATALSMGDGCVEDLRIRLDLTSAHDGDEVHGIDDVRLAPR